MLLVWLAGYFLLKLLGRETQIKGFLLLSAIVYGAALLYMTLLSRGSNGGLHYQLELLWEYRQAFRFEAGKLNIQDMEFVWYIANNILLFIPLGVLLGEFYDTYRRRPLLWVLFTGGLVSALLEISQLVFRIGLFELDDILNNTIGGVLGFGCYALAKRMNRIRMK